MFKPEIQLTHFLNPLRMSAHQLAIMIGWGEAFNLSRKMSNDLGNVQAYSEVGLVSNDGSIMLKHVKNSEWKKQQKEIIT